MTRTRDPAPVVLLVDDDAAIRRAVGAGLELEGFRVVRASGGRAALAAIESVRPAVILLDLAMPDLDGLEVLRRLRAARRRRPGLRAVGARRGRRPRARAAGGRRRLRRQAVRARGGDGAAAGAAAPPARRRRRPCSASATSRSTRARTSRCRGERDLGLTRREFDLLHLFMRHPGEVLDRARLHEEVWGYTFDPGTNIADVFVGYLRRKLEADGEPRVLQTVRGIGFILQV